MHEKPAQSEARLDAASADALTDALADMWDAADELTYSEDWMEQCLEKLEHTGEAAPDFDVEASLANFLDQHSHIVECASEKAGRKASRWKSRTAIAAAAVLVMLGSMVTAQALGLDVFGAIARWTDETFRFHASAEGNGLSAGGIPEDVSGTYETLEAALAACGIDETTIPTEALDGFSAGEISVHTAQGFVSIRANYASEERAYSLIVSLYASPDAVSQTIFEKDSGDVRSYEKDGIPYYVMSNNADLTVAWMPQERLVCALAGALTAEEAQTLIDLI